MKRFGVIFLSPGDVEGETSEKLEFDDPLNEHAMFLRSQGLRNETNMIQKRTEIKQRSREEAKREQRSAKSTLKTVLGGAGATSFDFAGPWGRHGGTHDSFAHA